MKLLSFRNIWRFNAIVIAMIGLFVVLAIVYNLWSFLSYNPPVDDFDTTRTEEVVAGEEKVRLTFDGWIELAGSDYLALRYGVTGQEIQFSGSAAIVPGKVTRSGQVEPRNVVLINKNDGTFRHIAPDNEKVLHNFYVLKSGDTKKAMGYIAQFQSRRGDGTDILIGNLSTGKQDWVLTNIDALDYPRMVNATISAMIVWDQETPRFVEINIDNLEIQRDQRISLSPQN